MQGEHLPSYTWKDVKAMRRNGGGPTSYCVNSLLIKKMTHVFGDREKKKKKKLARTLCCFVASHHKNKEEEEEEEAQSSNTKRSPFFL